MHLRTGAWLRLSSVAGVVTRSAVAVAVPAMPSHTKRGVRSRTPPTNRAARLESARDDGAHHRSPRRRASLTPYSAEGVGAVPRTDGVRARPVVVRHSFDGVPRAADARPTRSTSDPFRP